MDSHLPHTPKTDHRRRARLILLCLLLSSATADAGTLGEAIDSALDLEGHRRLHAHAQRRLDAAEGLSRDDFR